MPALPLKSASTSKSPRRRVEKINRPFREKVERLLIFSKFRNSKLSRPLRPTHPNSSYLFIRLQLLFNHPPCERPRLTAANLKVGGWLCRSPFPTRPDEFRERGRRTSAACSTFVSSTTRFAPSWED